MVSSGSKNFISQADKVGLNLAGRLAVDTVNCLIARICDFFGVFGQFDLWCKVCTVCIAWLQHLVYTTEGRPVAGE